MENSLFTNVKRKKLWSKQDSNLLSIKRKIDEVTKEIVYNETSPHVRKQSIPICAHWKTNQIGKKAIKEKQSDL